MLKEIAVTITTLNGHLPDGALTAIDGSGHRLRSDAASSFARASAAYGHPLPVISAYRTLAEQQQLWDGYVNHRPGYNPANRPGTSQHGEGLSIDLTSTAAIAWMSAHGATFGWSQTYRASEPWHFDYDPARDRSTTPTPSPTTAPAPTPLDPMEDDDMNTERALQAAYRQQVGRTPGDTELDDRILRIALGQSTLAGEIAAIDRSTESDRYAVHQVYLELLRRDGSVSEWDYWISATGNDVARIRAGITASDEYKKLHP